MPTCFFRRTAAAAAVTMLGLTAGMAQDFTLPGAPFDAASVPDRPTLPPIEEFDFDKVMRAAVAQNDALAAHRPDITGLALDLMLDPEAAFAFFRDEIVTEPYQGHLRATYSVLEAGRANAHDKARALGEMLNLLGYDTRLVSAAAPADLAARLAAGACRITRAPLQRVWDVAALNPDIMSRVAARGHAGYDALLAASTPPEGAHAPPGQGAEHVWLQARIGPDWVDLDPAEPGTAFGEAPAGPGTLLEAEAEPHRITIDLSVETLSNGALRRNSVLTHRITVPEMVEHSFTLVFGPQTDGVGGILADTLANLQGQSAGMTAMLLIGDDAVKSRPFFAPGVAETAGGFFDAGQEVISTAMVLTVTGIAPGQPDEVATRVIFDLVPPELREDGAAPPTPDSLARPEMGARFPAVMESIRQIVIGNGGLSAYRASARMAAVLGDIPDAVQAALAGQPDPEAFIWNSWVQASTVALASEELIRAQRGPDGGCVIMGRPRALIWGTGQGEGGLDLYWMDWVLDGVEIAGVDSQAEAWRHRLWHGALQSGLEIEALLTQLDAPSGTKAIPPGPLAPLGPEAIAALGPEAEADAAAGFILLGGPDLGPQAWWRIDPVTGRTDARIAYFGNAFNLIDLFRNPFNRPAARASSLSSLEARIHAYGTEESIRAWNQRVLDEACAAGRSFSAKDKLYRRSKLKHGGGNEYIILLLTVSIPIATEAGSAIGGAVTQGVRGATSAI